MTDGTPARRRAHPARANGTRPLLQPFALTVMTLASFLIVFALLMARLTGGARFAAAGEGGATPTAALVGESRGRTVSTRTSGALPAQSSPAPLTPSAASSTAQAAVVSRASGGHAGWSGDE